MKITFLFGLPAGRFASDTRSSAFTATWRVSNCSRTQTFARAPTSRSSGQRARSPVSGASTFTQANAGGDALEHDVVGVPVDHADDWPGGLKPNRGGAQQKRDGQARPERPGRGVPLIES